MKLNWYLKKHHHDYYSLVEPFRKDGKNQHNKLFYFGRLTDEELKTINYALDILKNCSIEKPKFHLGIGVFPRYSINQRIKKYRHQRLLKY
jgi:hypothetical protein